jgi:DNA-binding NtrC family response regulator
MISGHGDLDTAVDSMKKGAYDYISKPPDLNRLLNTVRNAIDKKNLTTQNTLLKRKIINSFEMVGESKELNNIKELIKKVSPTDAKILITGPNGSGKELVAKSIHSSSNRAHSPLIEVNCAAIPSELIESELFGHVKGSFTGAVKDKTGKFEAANSGTIFLDEVGDMSLSAQAKVLRVLQDNCIQKVGGGKDIKIDVRVIAATNKDLKNEIEKGKFREDLFHRLAVIIVKVPSLNKRRDDIPLLISHFSDNISRSQGSDVKKFSKSAIKLLKSMDWTGNVRELRNVVERLIILGDENEISDKNVKEFAK